MGKFNLSKTAADKRYKSYDKMLSGNNTEHGIETVDSSTTEYRLSRKNKDNTVPFEKQIDAVRKGKDNLMVAEKALNTEPKVFLDKRNEEWDTSVMPINLETEKHHQKHVEAFKDAEKNDKETLFWDKYVGKQILREVTKVDKNVSETQLENAPERFKNLEDATDVEIKKMVSASLKDADAVLFHIYATDNKEDRDLNDKEKQIVVDINSGKMGLITKAMNIMEKRASDSQVVIKEQNGKSVVYENGVPIDKFNSSNEAKTNYPEAKIL